MGSKVEICESAKKACVTGSRDACRGKTLRGVAHGFRVSLLGNVGRKSAVNMAAAHGALVQPTSTLHTNRHVPAW